MFLTNSLSTTSVNIFKSTGTVPNLPTSKSPSFVYKLFKLVEILTNFLMCNLSTLAFKAIESFLAGKLYVSTPAASSNSFLVA